MNTIRRRVSGPVWSRGVQLAREGRVVGRSVDDEEVVLQVNAPGESVAVDVYLWPGDGDWSCECGRPACVHAAAAVIAQNLALKAGREMPRPRNAPQLGYALTRGRGGLEIKREIIIQGESEPLDGPVRRSGVPINEADLAIDRVMAMGARNLPAGVWRNLLGQLANSSAQITLDGQPVQVRAEPVPPVVQVRDEGEGFLVSLHRPREVTETFRGGIYRLGDTLRPSSGGGLSPAQRQALIRGVRYAPEEVGDLVGMLERLRRGLTVRVRTSRLPEGQASPPAVQLSLTPRGESLEVRADVVYGDPPAARIEDGRLVFEGEVVPIRDLERERALVEQTDRVLKIPMGRPWRLDEDEILDFVQNRIPRFQGRVVGDVGQFKVRRAPVNIALREGAGALGLTVECEAEPEALYRAWRAGRSLVPLLSGGYAPLPADFLERHGELLFDLLGAADDSGALPRHAAAPAAALARALDAPPPPTLERLKPLVEGFDGLPDYPLPPDLVGELRPYQVEGYRWLRFLQDAGLGGILADDMGLGKTVQALCAIRHAGGKSLAVVPRSVLRNWESESNRFFPDMKVHVYHGTGRKLDARADLTVTTYAIARRDKPLRERSWKVVVLDEAQAIKNPTSQTAQAVFTLQAEHRLSLTGTPVENRLDELWSQLHFLMPGFLGGRRLFQDRYARPIEQGDQQAARRLRARLKPFVLRRLKSQVARDLPPRTEIVLSCEMPEPQRRAYEAVYNARRAEVLAALNRSPGAKKAGAAPRRAFEVLEYLLRLRQAACDPALLPGDASPGDPEIVSGKLKVLGERLDQVIAEGHRALVFSQWTSLLDRIGAAMDKRQIGYLRLDGATRNRAALVDRFQADDGPPVFLISLKAGGTGLNLTAADYVFHTDPWWNPAVEDQATDRAHRIGQTRPVVSVKLVSEGTVEERILALQAAKRSLAQAAIGDEAALVRGLTQDDLRALIA